MRARCVRLFYQEPIYLSISNDYLSILASGRGAVPTGIWNAAKGGRLAFYVVAGQLARYILTKPNVH